MTDTVEPGSSPSLHHADIKRLDPSLRAESLREAKSVFEQVYKEYEQEVVMANGLVEKGKNPSSMKDNERRYLSDYNNMQVVLEVTNNGQIEFELPGLEIGNGGRNYENVPVEGLTDFLERKMRRMRSRVAKLESEERNGRALSASEKEEIARLESQLTSERKKYESLRDHSVRLLDLPHGKEIPQPGTFAYERLQWEAYMISQDPLRASTNPDPAARMKEDWMNASKALDRRRVLVDPAPMGTIGIGEVTDEGAPEDGDPVTSTPDERGGLMAANANTNNDSDDEDEDDTASNTSNNSSGSAVSPAPVVSQPPASGVSAATASGSGSGSGGGSGTGAAAVSRNPGTPLTMAPVNPTPVASQPASAPVVVSPGVAYPGASGAGSSSIAQSERYSTLMAGRDQDRWKRARDQARRQVDKELKQGKMWPWDILKRAKVRWMENYYVTKYTEVIMNEMIANNNSFLEYDFVNKAAMNVNKQREMEAGKANIGMLQQAVENNLVDTLGLKVVDVGQDSPPLKNAILSEILRPLASELNGGSLAGKSAEEKDKYMQERLRGFIKKYNDLNTTNPDELEVKRKLQQLFGDDSRKYTDIAKYFASDMVEMAQKIVDDRRALDFANGAIDDIIDIRIANTTWASGTEHDLTGIDKVYNWAKNTRLPPMAMAAIASLGVAIPMKILRSKVTHLAVPLVGTLVGGAATFARKMDEERIDLTTYKIERAYRKQSTSKDRKHQRYESHSYDVKDYEALLSGVPHNPNAPQTPDQIYNEKGTGQMFLQLDTELSANPDSRTAQDEINKRIAEILTRVHLEIRTRDASANKDIRDRDDWIRGSDEFSKDQNRAFLVQEAITLRENLKKEVEKALRNAGRAADIPTRLAQIEQSQQAEEAAWAVRLLKNKKDQDRHALVDRVWQSTKATGFGMVAGLATGIVGHDAAILIERGGGKAVEGTVAFLHDRGLASAQVLDNVQNANHALNGQTYTERLFDRNSTNDILKRLTGFIEPPQTNVTSEQFIGLYNHATTVDLGSHYSVVSDGHGGIAFADRITHQNLNFPVKPTIDQNGVMHLVGDQANTPNDLPVDLRKELAQANFDIKPGPLHPETIFGNPTDGTVPGSIPATEHASVVINGIKHDVLIPKGTEFRVDKSGFTDLVLVDPNNPAIDGTPVYNDVQFKPDGTMFYDEKYSAFKMSEFTTVDSKVNIAPEQMWNENSTHVDKFEGYSYNLHQVKYDSKLHENIAVGHRVELDARDYKPTDGQYVMEMHPTNDVSIQKGIIPEQLDLQKYFDPKYGGEQGAFAFIHQAGDGRHDIIAIKPNFPGKLLLDVNDTSGKTLSIYDPNTHDYTKTVSLRDFSKMYVNEQALQHFTGASQVGKNYELLNLLGPNAPAVGPNDPQPYGMLSLGQMVMEDKNGVPVMQTATGALTYYDGKPVTDTKGIQTVWKSVSAGIFNGRPTPIETGGKIPSFGGHRIDIERKSWDIFPPTEVNDTPLIPLPWDPRDPLKELAQAPPVTPPPPTPPLTPPVPPPAYPGGYGSGPYTGRSNLTNIAINLQPNYNSALPSILQAAYQRLGTPVNSNDPNNQNYINGLTPTEQVLWLQNNFPALVGSPTNGSSPTSVSPPNIQQIAAALNVALPGTPPANGAQNSSATSTQPAAVGVPASASPATTPSTQGSPVVTQPIPTPVASGGGLNTPTAQLINIESFINGNTSGGISPIDPASRALAQTRAQRYMTSQEIIDAENAGGLTVAESGELFQNVTNWLAANKNDLISLELNDSTVDTVAYRQQVHDSADLFTLGVGTDSITNMAIRYIEQSGGTTSPIISKGDANANLTVLFNAIENIRDLQFS